MSSLDASDDFKRPSTNQAPPNAPNAQGFHYNVNNDQAKAVAVLTIFGHGALSKNMATIVGGHPVTGTVKLHLDKPESYQSVSVHVQGQYVIGTGEQMTFLNVSQNLWTKEMGEPTHDDSDDTHPPLEFEESHPKVSNKLPVGDYSWNFSIDLPQEVTLPGHHGKPTVFKLPETLKDNNIRPSIDYGVRVNLIKRKKLLGLQSEYSVTGPFAYIPLSRPPPFPPLRLLAYQEGTPLKGPTADPEGWHALAPVKIKGHFPKTHSVEIGSTLFLAKPLSYTRGSIIPLCLQLESEDSRALDVVSQPSSIVVRLRRRIGTGEAIDVPIVGTLANDDPHLAVWQPTSEAGPSGSTNGRKLVNGELRLRPDLHPSAAISTFILEYSVGLYPFDADGIEFAHDMNKPLVEEHVEVVSTYAEGPRPKSGFALGTEHTPTHEHHRNLQHPFEADMHYF